MKCPNCGKEVTNETVFCSECGTKIISEEAVVQEAPSYPHNISTVWPEWQIEKILGKGSFGVVYQAIRQDNNVVSRSAIKVVSIPQDASEVESLRSEGLTVDDSRTYYRGIVDDFVNEIQLMESFKGTEHIVSVEDYKVIDKVNEIGWDIYIRMELLTPFNTFLVNNTMTEEQVIQLGIDICDALEKCNQRNIIHRDIKPENIFINNFGAFKLGDFGIARKMENMTNGMSQKGTYNYMAPEVFRGTQYDGRADIYSLGIVLYRLLNSNRLPFLNNEQQLLDPNERKNALDRRLNGELLPVPCNASEGMANIILKACAFDASARFNSATELKQALLELKAGSYRPVALDLDKTTSVNRAAVQAVSANPEAANVPTTFGKKKSKAPIIIVILLLLVALIVVGVFFLYPKLTKSNSSNTDTNTKVETSKDNDEEEEQEKITRDEEYSKSENKQITKIIEEAEELATSGDYSSALSKIENGLITYPLSERLKVESEEYAAIIAAQEKANILAEAKTYADNGDYVSAIYLLRNELANGEDADYQAAYDSYCTAYEESVLEITYQKASNQAYDEAIQDITDALEVIPENASLNAAKDSYYAQKMENIKSVALTTAQEYSNNGDNLQALNTIKQAISEVGQDEALTAVAQTYEDAYVQNILAQVDQHLQNQDVESAKTVLDTALSKLPNNATLQERRSDMDKYKSVPLHTLEMYNTQGKYSTSDWEWNSGTAMDKIGNDYSLSTNYVIPNSSYDPVAEYKVDKQYSTISFKVAPHANCSTSSDRVAWVYLYVNDVLRYTIPEITNKSGVIEVSNIDISDAEYIKLVVHSNANDFVIFSDVILNTIPGYVSTIDHSYTSLNLVNCISSSNWDWNRYRPYDMLGSDYTYIHNSVASKYDIYAEYAVDKQYTSISLDIAPRSYSSSAKGIVYIYADDVMIYKSPEVNYKTTKFNTGEIDISGASFIKISINSSTSADTILSDIMLKNAVVNETDTTAEITTESVTE